jgi:hypothetical protein
MSEIFDFGFTAVDEDELEAVQQISSKVEETADEVTKLQNKVSELYNAVVPLLNNLKKNPEKDYIHWPNRLKKVEEFEDYLQNIYNR